MSEQLHELQDVRVIEREYGQPRPPEGRGNPIVYPEFRQSPIEVEKTKREVEILNACVEIVSDFAAELGFDAKNRLKGFPERTRVYTTKSFPKKSSEGNCRGTTRTLHRDILLDRGQENELGAPEAKYYIHELIHQISFKQLEHNKQGKKEITRVGYRTPNNTFHMFNEALTELTAIELIVTKTRTKSALSEFKNHEFKSTHIGYLQDVLLLDKAIMTAANNRDITYLEQLRELQIGMITGDVNALKVFGKAIGENAISTLGYKNSTKNRTTGNTKLIAMGVEDTDIIDHNGIFLVKELNTAHEKKQV